VPTLMGDVSTEGGPFLIADRAALARWSGDEGGDYERLLGSLRVGQPRTLALNLDGAASLAWNIPTGTAQVWRLGPTAVLLTRSWVDQDEDLPRLAQPPMRRTEPMGTVDVASGWLVILWAPEPGADVLAVEPRDGWSLDLSVGGAGLVVQVPPGRYECWGDEVDIGSASAWRCLIVPDPSR
jgi:hypothetical protein